MNSSERHRVFLMYYVSTPLTFGILCMNKFYNTLYEYGMLWKMTIRFPMPFLIIINHGMKSWMSHHSFRVCYPAARYSTTWLVKRIYLRFLQLNGTKIIYVKTMINHFCMCICIWSKQTVKPDGFCTTIMSRGYVLCCNYRINYKCL